LDAPVQDPHFLVCFRWIATAALESGSAAIPSQLVSLNTTLTQLRITLRLKAKISWSVAASRSPTSLKQIKPSVKEYPRYWCGLPDLDIGVRASSSESSLAGNSPLSGAVLVLAEFLVEVTINTLICSDETSVDGQKCIHNTGRHSNLPKFGISKSATSIRVCHTEFQLKLADQFCLHPMQRKTPRQILPMY